MNLPGRVYEVRGHCYITPESVEVIGFTKRRPVAVFNPGVLLEGRKLRVFAG